jgi:hypothetical protein
LKIRHIPYQKGSDQIGFESDRFEIRQVHYLKGSISVIHIAMSAFRNVVDTADNVEFKYLVEFEVICEKNALGCETTAQGEMSDGKTRG